MGLAISNRRSASRPTIFRPRRIAAIGSTVHMPEYRRMFAPGATFFFTLVTLRRRPILVGGALTQLRTAFESARKRRHFVIDAIVVLPDHLHCVWTLPHEDTAYSIRWKILKERFTVDYLGSGGVESPVSPSRLAKKERGVWQRRFWEHTIRDVRDYETHMDYIHYNPVKHGLAVCPHAWPPSSFHRWVQAGRYGSDWCCTCAGKALLPPDFSSIEGRVGE
jgi:putative transposase